MDPRNKICNSCNLRLSYDLFPKSKPTGNPKSTCKKCNAERQRERNRTPEGKEYWEKYKKTVNYRLSTRKTALKYSSKIEELKRDKPCIDCGKLFPHYCMDFDHLENKKFAISGYKFKPLEVLQEEINKCELVCANCHRIRTYNRIQQSRDANGLLPYKSKASK